jgi:hypothetical protein
MRNVACSAIRANRQTGLDFSVEPPVPLNLVGDLLPVPRSLPTIRAWAVRGVRGVKLEMARIGGRLFTTEAAVGRFLDAIAVQ